MNSVSRGIRNAFRNLTRTLSIVVILGLSMGLALAMLIAHQAVSDKINSVKASVGNTITISPAGFSGFSSVNNSLTTSTLDPVKSIPHVSSLNENLNDRLTTIGSDTSSSPFDQSSSSNNTTSLTSPVTLNSNGDGNFGGGGMRLFIAGGGQLPANFSLPISILGTSDPSHLNATDIKIISGTSIDGSQDSNNALISNNMANKNNLKVGSTFTAYGTTMTVAGIFSSSSNNATRGADNTIIVSLPAEQRLSGQSGDVTSAVANVDSIDNLTTTTNAIKDKLGSSADVTSSLDQANQAIEPLNSVKTISVYSLIGAVIAGGVIILLTMVMIVRERTKEIGVIKAIGASNTKVTSQFMSEAVTLTMIGAVVGILFGAIAANPVTHLLITNSSSSPTSTIGGPRSFAGGPGGGGGPRFATGGRGAFGFVRNNFSNIHAAVGWSIIAYGLLAALLIAVVGSLASSYFIAKIRPAEVMRTE